MNDMLDEVSSLVEEAIRRLLPCRSTFTEKEALGWVWQSSGYEVSIQSDTRFVLAQEGYGKHPRHWRLDRHTIANNRLLNDLLSGAWDGRDLDRKLATLDAEDQCHYVFCPIDPRLQVNKQGILEPAEHERNVALPRTTKAELDALVPLLLAHWRETGAEPLTVRSITEELRRLGWSDSGKPNAWLYVRSWLLGWPQVTRVGQDYWVLADQIPQEISRTRLQVMAVRTPLVEETSEAEGTPAAYPVALDKREVASKVDESQVVLSGEATATHATWSVRLRTVNLLEGFLHIPKSVHGAYPPPAPGESNTVTLRGVWFEDNTQCWFWLDRARHRLYGPDLAAKLAWLEAGDIMRVEWAPDVMVIRVIGHDEEVHNEESRLVDREELAALRGGLGESYRRSLQAMLLEASQGLTFAELVQAMRERQNHAVHRGTIRTLLHSGGFVRRNRRWFAAYDNEAGARQLRAAMVEALVASNEDAPEQPISQADYVLRRINAIHTRLSEIVKEI